MTTSPRKIGLSEAKAKFAALVDEVRSNRDEPVWIHKREVPVAVLVEAGTYRRLKEMEDLVLSLRLKEALQGRKSPLREVLREIKLGV